MHQPLSLTDPEEVDVGLLRFCSSQLKLLQLYIHIQQLHSAPHAEAYGTPLDINQARVLTV